MLDFSKISDTEFAELKTTIQKSVEKSDFERNYLFSTDKFVKAKLFILSYRFLLNAYRFFKVSFNAFTVCAKAGKLLFTYIAETGKYFAVNLLLILEYGKGAEREAPSFMLKQSNH